MGTALCLHEWINYIEEQDSLNVPAGPKDKNFVIIILYDNNHFAELKFWNLIIGKHERKIKNSEQDNG